ncbi:YggS family pyridoxal phosphate-dependent enzyme [Parabacteroides sp. PF5-6]|uniref:YggS family pyridoxal phosphate-dependent enzyme n=1 Tax=Parabacteroides sp. PF5-6 TaxID=1742403 RepID=UPI002404F885|nr:YggS family pyridoxal phosphate-dependent enzyme [Parabacteroides sp. PF5-6]MDF9828906.1 pyridoxal phosphate enzyme (YggS family) [Parabacteroides sp. PF5-6]
MNITRNIQTLKASLPQGVTLIAVSKFHPSSAIREAYEAGHRVFGESRAQELKVKQKELPEDIEWHFIGTLQSNKVKDIAAYIHTIHSIDSLKLLQEVEKQAAKHQRVIRVLLEIHLAQEETKQGMTPAECKALLTDLRWEAYPHVQIAGLMCMATDTDDTTLIRKEFQTLQQLFGELRSTFFPADCSFNELSMGMSHDYPIAIEEGSTMIRVGTRIFGIREY